MPAENNPPGDIPDNLAFVPYRNPAGGYAFTHPEGWPEVTHGTTVTFTDKLNGSGDDRRPAVGTDRRDGAAPPSCPLARTQAAFEAGRSPRSRCPPGRA